MAVRIAVLWALAIGSGAILIAQPTSDSVRRIKVHGKHLEGNPEGDSADRDVSIYLPSGYSTEPTRRYPVLYLLHGTPLTDQYWTGVKSGMRGVAPADVPAAMRRAAANGSAQPMIIVMPNAFSNHGGNMYARQTPVDAWEEFVTQDLIAYVDSHYRTLDGRMNRGLAGHSMGAYGAMKIGMKHPEIYSSLYIMSVCCVVNIPGSGVDGLGPMLRQYSGSLTQYEAIAIDVGVHDGLLDTNKELERRLTAAGIAHSFDSYDGDHMNRITERMETKVLPFFSTHLGR
jgi:enterochelin esterase-like enzyme